MPKTIDARIAYYTRKVAQHFGRKQQWTPERIAIRHGRLMHYKAAMHKKIEKEVPEWITRPYLKS